MGAREVLRYCDAGVTGVATSEIAEKDSCDTGHAAARGELATRSHSHW